MFTSRTLFFFALLLPLTGCVKSLPKTRYFWPPLPDEPKIEHMGAYRTYADFPKSKSRDILFSTVFGEDVERVLSKPWGIAGDGKGKVYLTDAGQGAIVVFDIENYEISKIKDIGSTYGITIDSRGRIYATSGQHNKDVKVYGADGKALWGFGQGVLVSPAGLAVNEEMGLVYVVDTKAHDIKVFNLPGDYLFSIGKRGTGNAEFNFPTDIDINSRGELIVADSLNARIQVLDGEGKFIRAFGKRGMARGYFQFIKGVAVDSEDHIYVTDTMAGSIMVFSMEGELLLIVGGTYSAGGKGMAAGGLNLPMDIDIDENDRIYVVDQQNHAFQVFQYLNEDYLNKNPIVVK